MKGEWHFIRRTNDIRSYTDSSSKAIGKTLKKSQSCPLLICDLNFLI